jgi:long-chain acyl-CoA synthetase
MTGRLASLLERAVATGFCRVESAGEVLDAPDLDAIGAHVAKELRERGTEPSEPVVVLMENRAADIGALFGIWRAGLVAVPVQASTPPAALAEVQRTVGARLVVDRSAVYGEGPPAPPRPLLEEAALIIHTSGSTGRPKGVVIGHERLAEKIDVLQRLLQVGSDDVVLLPLQLTFIFGLWVSLLTLQTNARLVLIRRFSGAAVADALRREATIAAVVPTMLRSLALETSPFPSRIRMVLTGGEPLGVELAGSTMRAFPQARVFDLYGSTETGSCDFCLAIQGAAGLGTIGAPTEQVRFKIVSDDGSPAEPGETGELCIRSPFGMLGYLDDAVATAAAIGDGYFRSGDLARVRADGVVELVGRRKEIISRGAVKIAPLEVEALFTAHPHIESALCGGVPDARLGETVHLLVVPRRGMTLHAEELRGWAAVRIAPHKLPDGIHIVSELPVGRTGKADRSGVARYISSGTGISAIPRG